MVDATCKTTSGLGQPTPPGLTQRTAGMSGETLRWRSESGLQGDDGTPPLPVWARGRF
ncbi:MAG: hypothetical protein H8F28_01890 [Fibrella sp.]|nr:hypothetical protein [Armatimonadota bacterium]